MTVKDIAGLLNAEILTKDAVTTKEVLTACGSDMMSDVLAFAKTQCVLLTGLCNPQVIRTAEMMDIICIVFVRGKMPDESMIAMAEEKEIPILITKHRMFESCGLLYTNGLRGGANDV